MFRQMPYEISLTIFEYVFEELRGRETINIDDTTDRCLFRLADEVDGRNYSGAMLFLDASVAGSGTAAAAAETLYRSGCTFAVNAEFASSFLKSCPISRAIQPGQYIRRLHIWVDENPKGLANGLDVETPHEVDSAAVTGETPKKGKSPLISRVELMQECWAVLLDMPKLRWLEILVRPAQGRLDVFLPTWFRLSEGHVYLVMYLRGWELYKRPENLYLRSLTTKPEMMEWRIFESRDDPDRCFTPHHNLPQSSSVQDDVKDAGPMKDQEQWYFPTDGRWPKLADRQEGQDPPHHSRGPYFPYNHVVANYEAVLELFYRVASSAGKLLNPHFVDLIANFYSTYSSGR